jgi:hypothetical protein
MQLRVPQEYTTIQRAIDASSDGDTVIVSEGTYFENIRYRGKAITVASLFLIDGDATHIQKTTIDGSRSTDSDSGSVVSFVGGEDTTSVLCGLTIQGGTGTNWYMDTMLVRSGGGVFCCSGGARIVRNLITRNRVVAPWGTGGGVEALPGAALTPIVILEGNLITENYAEGTAVPSEWASGSGGVDISGADARVIGNVFERDTAVSNTETFGGGMTLRLLPRSYAPVLVARNVFRSNLAVGTELGVYGGGLALHSTGEVTVEQNLFEANTAIAMGMNGVAAGGGMCVGGTNDNESGRKLILNNQFLNNRAESHANGDYWAIGGGLALHGTGEVSVEQNLFEANTAIANGMNGGGTGGGMFVADSGAGRKLILNNRFLNNRADCPANGGFGRGGGLDVNGAVLTISGNTFRGNISTGSRDANSGALFMWGSSFRLEGNIFTENSSSSGGPGENAGGGGALFLVPQHQGDEQLVANNVFYGNNSRAGGGAISMWDATEGKVPLCIVNNTLIGNSSLWDGGGIHFGNTVDVIFMNNILWENRSAGFYHQISNFSSLGHFLNNDIMGGWSVGSGNIDVPPLFAGGTHRLSDSSFCIGAGVDSVFVGSTWYRPPDHDIDGSPRPSPSWSHPDIGAYENPLPISTAASVLSFSPQVCNFGNVLPGSLSDTLRIAAANRDTITRLILSLSTPKAEFAFTPAPILPVTIPPLGQAELKLVYSPGGPGESNQDTLVIGTTDRHYPTKRVMLKGRGSDSVRCARPGVLYGISGSSGAPRVLEIDRQTGNVSASSEVSPHAPQGVRALTVRRHDNTLYAAFPSASGTDLYRISSQYGDFETFGAIPVADVTSMAFSPADVLYLITASGGMYSIAHGIGDTTYLGSTAHPFTGLAFSPATGVLWASIRDSVFTVDNGLASFVGASDWHAPRSSIAFNPLGAMYGIFGMRLVMIDRVWATPTEVGETAVTDMVAIAMRSDLASAEIESVPELPREADLFCNYPNPFNLSTTIRYALPARSQVKLTVFNTLGQEVVVLEQGEKEAGYHEARFDGCRLATGVYFYRLHVNDYVASKKFLLIK